MEAVKTEDKKIGQGNASNKQKMDEEQQKNK